MIKFPKWKDSEIFTLLAVISGIVFFGLILTPNFPLEENERVYGVSFIFVFICMGLSLYEEYREKN